jgi:hypothetical protein
MAHDAGVDQLDRLKPSWLAATGDATARSPQPSTSRAPWRSVPIGATRRAPFMFAMGCVQAQTCHTGHCPTGVTTQDPLRQRALVVGDKAERVWRFHEGTLEALKELVQAAGLRHPSEISASHIVRRVSHQEVRLLANILPLMAPGCLAEGRMPHPVSQAYWHLASEHSFAAQGALAALLQGGRQSGDPH